MQQTTIVESRLGRQVMAHDRRPGLLSASPEILAGKAQAPVVEHQALIGREPGSNRALVQKPVQKRAVVPLAGGQGTKAVPLSQLGGSGERHEVEPGFESRFLRGDGTRVPPELHGSGIFGQEANPRAFQQSERFGHPGAHPLQRLGSTVRISGALPQPSDREPVPVAGRSPGRVTPLPQYTLHVIPIRIRRGFELPVQSVGEIACSPIEQREIHGTGQRLGGRRPGDRGE